MAGQESLWGSWDRRHVLMREHAVLCLQGCLSGLVGALTAGSVGGPGLLGLSSLRGLSWLASSWGRYPAHPDGCYSPGAQ